VAVCFVFVDVETAEPFSVPVQRDALALAVAVDNAGFALGAVGVVPPPVVVVPPCKSRNHCHFHHLTRVTGRRDPVAVVVGKAYASNSPPTRVLLNYYYSS
jgi:hypothetical protein